MPDSERPTTDIDQVSVEQLDKMFLPAGAVMGILDGVSAIVLTLLVLNLRLPSPLPPGGLQQALWNQRWTFVAYAFGVVYIGTVWLGTRFTLRRHRYIDEWTALYYVGHLGAIAVLPFAVDAIGRSTGNAANLGTAVRLWCAMMIVADMFWYLAMARLDRLGLHPHSIRGHHWLRNFFADRSPTLTALGITWVLPAAAAAIVASELLWALRNVWIAERGRLEQLRAASHAPTS